MKDRVRVLHVISGLGVGGAERLLLWAARYHDRERYPLGVISLMSGGELADQIHETGVPLVELGQKKGRLTPGGLIRLLGQIRRFRPQILQGHMFHSNILVRIAHPVILRPGFVINTVHGESEPWHRRIIDTGTARLTDGFITFSPRAEEVFTSHSRAGRPIRHIPYGIEILPKPERDKADLREILGLPPHCFLWVTAGRLTRVKAFEDMIEAFSLVRGKKNEGILIIAGEGDERPALERRIREKGLQKSIHLLGLRKDVPGLMAAADAFVLSSRSEGNPLVLLEAMGASLPVVATKVGAVPTMAVEGKTALLVPPGRPALLAEAMEKVMGMGKESRKMGEAGRERLERYYDFRQMQREVETFYDELTAGRGDSSL